MLARESMRRLAVVLHQFLELSVACKIHVLFDIDPVDHGSLARCNLVAALPPLAFLHDALVPEQCALALNDCLKEKRYAVLHY